jgi:hypothetical protein
VKGGTTQKRASKAWEKLASIDARLNMLTWMVGCNLLLTVTVLWRLFSH